MLQMRHSAFLLFLSYFSLVNCWWQPEAGSVTWQWQLSETEHFNTSYDVVMYDGDLFDLEQSAIDQLHSQGRIVICYFCAGSVEPDRPDTNEFPDSVIGKTIPDWPEEKYLDIRQIDLLAPILTARMDLAVSKKCDGVEPDWMHTYELDTGFDITAQNQIDFNVWLATQAHARGLSIALKNDINQMAELVDHFDFVVNEECFTFDECDTLQPFIDANKAVLVCEYEAKPGDFCPAANAQRLNGIVADLDLSGNKRIGCEQYLSTSATATTQLVSTAANAQAIATAAATGATTSTTTRTTTSTATTTSTSTTSTAGIITSSSFIVALVLAISLA